MAGAIKKITIDWSETGKTVYCIVRREADGYLLSDADGAFANAPADPFIALTEDGTIKGRYELSESRAVWSDGSYTVAIYKQAGGSPAPASDTIIGSGQMSIVSDAEVVNVLVSDKTGFSLSSTGADLILKSSTFIQAIVAAVNEYATYGLTALNTLLTSTGIKAASVPNVILANGAHGGAATVITLQTPIEANVASETNHDFTALQKTSLNAATPVVTVSDKTGFSLSSVGILAIWDYLTASFTGVIGSIGNLLKTNIDGKISETSKPGTAQTITPPADMALNSTVAKEATKFNPATQTVILAEGQAMIGTKVVIDEDAGTVKVYDGSNNLLNTYTKTTLGNVHTMTRT